MNLTIKQLILLMFFSLFFPVMYEIDMYFTLYSAGSDDIVNITHILLGLSIFSVLPFIIISFIIVLFLFSINTEYFSILMFVLNFIQIFLALNYYNKRKSISKNYFKNRDKITKN